MQRHETKESDAAAKQKYFLYKGWPRHRDEQDKHRQQNGRAPAGLGIAPQEQVFDLLVEVSHVTRGHLAHDAVRARPSLVQVQYVQSTASLQTLSKPVRMLATHHAVVHTPMQEGLVLGKVAELQHIVQKQREERRRQHICVP